jgi:TPR repeat protein
MFNLANYYHEKSDDEKMIKLYLKAIELKDVDSMCNLAKYYESKCCNEKIIRYYSLAIELNYLKAYYFYGLWLLKNSDNDSMIELYISAMEIYDSDKYYKTSKFNKAISKYHDDENVVTKMLELLAIEYDNNKNSELAIKYYKLAMERGSMSAVFNLGQYYYENNNIENMFKYYLYGVELKDVDCMFELSLYYQQVNDFDNMKKYYLMALEEIDNCNYKKTLINDGEKDFNLFKIKEFLDTVEKPCQTVLNKIKNLKSKKEIMIFENKKKLFTQLNNIIDCDICYDIKLNIDLNCGHCCCIDCYPKLYK